MEVVGIVLAAGRGYRAGGKLPKQYETFKNARMLTLTLTALLKCKKIDAILVVINPLDINLYKDSIKNIISDRLLPYCYGGQHRSESVKLGLKVLKKFNPKNVLIHDAARPFVDTRTINRVLKSLKTNAAVLPVLPIFDAIWQKSKPKHKSMHTTPGPEAGIPISTVLGDENNYKITSTAQLKKFKGKN